MFKNFFLFLLATTTVFLSACSDPAQLPGFDSGQWKSDKFACKGVREEMIPTLDSLRRQLYGKNEQDIKDILGKPDSEELMTRGQRVFIYYLEPGTQCESKGRLSEANRIQIRFNATYKVNEITYAHPLKK